ncbi:MAG: tape measure protein [Phocaeicola massiliensis]|jgi:tape measure domain-containing protein
MAKLYFKVGSDWEEVVRLRNEIAKLKQELMSMDGTQSPAAFKALNAQLAASNQRLDELVTNAAKVGAEMDTGFKRKIFDASQVVNGFTEKILAQKAVVKDIEADVKRLGDAYRIALKRNSLSANSKLEEYNAARKALDEEKAALFGLTQQQAEARLSVKKLRDEYTLYKNDGRQVVETNEGIAISWKKALAVIGGAGVLKALGSEMIRVRGEFQSMQTAIETMVGKDMAGQLIPQIKELAKISPLTMSDMVGAEKMMLGFNIQAEDTIKYLKAISDISMGESSKFNSLTLAFSQMSAAGKLMGQDLNQMINAGFNPLQIISEKTGKSIATLKDEMSKGAVSAEMVQQAFIDATSAGGKFYNMSENASKTINGQLSMMQDALDSVFNELGTKSESVIMDGIQMTTSLIQNYETVGRILAGLVVTYGTYRTAVMLVTAAESKHTLVEIGLTNARLLARKAQLALNAAMLTNPYVALTVVIGGLATAMWAMSDSATAAARAQKEYNGIKDVAFKKEQEHKLKIEELLMAARDESLATLTRQKSLEELRKEYPKIFEQYDIEKLKLEDILKLKQKINEEDSRRSVQGRRDDYNALKQTIANQRRYLQLFDNPDLRKNMSDSDKEIWKMFSGNQSYVQVREQMEKNSELLKKYQKDMLDDNISAYKSNLKNYSKEKLEAELKLAQSSASKRNGFVVNGMMVKGGDLESIISSINGALAKKKSPTTYKQDYEKAKKDWDDAKKKLSEIEKDKSKFTSKQYEEAKKRAETTEKAYKNLGGITGSSLTKQENQAKKEAGKKLKQQEQLAEQLLSLRRKNQQDEINLMADGTEKKLAQIDLDYQKELDAIRKQEQEWSKANGGKLTKEQSVQISLSYSQAESKRDKSISDLNKEKFESDKKAWQEYFIEFGNYQEKRKNLVQKYDDEIAKLHTDSPEYAIKVAEKNQAVEQLDEQFGHSAKAMADLFEDAGNKSVSAIQTIIDKYETLVKYMSGTKESDGTNVTLDELKALGFTDKDIEKIEKGEISIKDVTDAIRGLKDELKGKSPWQAFVSDLEKGIEAIKKGGNDSKKVGQGITDIGNAVTSFAPALGEFGTNIANIFGASDSAITGITDALGGLGTTAAGVGQIMSGDIVGGAMSAVSGVSSVVSALDGLFGADYSYYDEMVEQYSLLNDIWDELIDKKLEYINTSYGAEANKVGEEALELAEKSIESYRILGKERLNAGSSAGSHSIGVRIRKGMSEQGWEEARKALNDEQWFKEISTGRMESLFDLSTEQLERLKSEAPTFWAKLDEDVRNYLDKIIDGEERIEEIHNQINEQLTQITFDGVYSNFIDTLMDMKASSKDAAEDISEYFMRAMLSEQVGALYQDKLKKWYEKFAKGMEDGSLTESERNALNAEYMGYIEEAMKLRDELAAATGYDKISQESTSQSASSKGFQVMSQDTGEELNGRFTALQISNEEIKNQNTIQSQSLNLLTAKADAILSINTETRNIADDTRDLIAQSYLELVQISENTGAIVKPIIQIQKDMAEVKNNTSKL